MVNQAQQATPAVDYAVVARRYARGRQLDARDLERWHDAIMEICPISGSTVLDLGAGTGIFTRAWQAWGAHLAVGCEPSPAMLGEMLRDHATAGLAARGFAPVAGRAEQIPIAAGCADVVWISNVLHHLKDVDAWIAETRRVLKPGGVLLVRNLFSDLGSISWTEEIPQRCGGLRGLSTGRRLGSPPTGHWRHPGRPD